MDYVDRRRKAAVAGHRGDEPTARALLDDADAGVRATALGALARAGALQAADLQRALADVDAGVRRRACEEAVGIGRAENVLQLVKGEQVRFPGVDGRVVFRHRGPVCAKAIAPMDEIDSLSESGAQFAPPSVVFHTPPATAPK